MGKQKITTLFVDIGGVLLTNGWDRQARERAAEKFDFDFEEMQSRHALTFDTYEIGKITLKEYLQRAVFFKTRPFTPAQFEKFMFEQSKPYPEMLKLVQELKHKHKLKVVVVSNEGRELTEHRIRKFKLDTFVDFFVSSCFVHLRKPDADIYHLALDMAQADPKEVIYLEDRPLFVDVAKALGIHAIHHIDYASTVEKLRTFF